MTNFKNSFQRHEQRKQLFDRDEYRENFGDPIYNEIDVNSPPIYNVYFDGDYVDN